MESNYEIATKKIVPKVRNALVEELKYKYDKTEEEIAKLLGITQAAISKKLKKGIQNKGSENEIHIDKELITEYAKKIEEGKETAQRCICKICNSVNDFGCAFSAVKNEG